MNTFAYEARNQEGQLTAGFVAAETLDHAGQLLSQRNLFVVRIGAEAARTDRRTANIRGHATRAQVAWCMSQLSIMVETRIRLIDALDCLARQARQPRLKVLLGQVSKSVEEGRSLSEAMQQHPHTFDSSLIAMIRASEMSGTLGRVLHRSAGYLMNDLQAIRRVRAAVAYPVFMFTVCMAVTVFLLTVILPKFADVFASRSALLPLPTRMLMGVSDSLITNWHLWLGGVAAACVIGFLWSRTRTFRRVRDRVVISAPGLAGIFKPLYMSRAFRTMGLLLETAVPLIDAMKIMQDIVPNVFFRDLWRQVHDDIERGERMAGPLLASRLIPEPIAQMIDSGDRSGKLGFVFSQLADFLEDEYNQAVKTATQFLEPCMIMFMGLIIGFVAASLMLPLFQASRIFAH